MDRTVGLEELRLDLLARRRTLIETHGTVQEELQALQAEDRNPEYEEGAQRKLAQDVLTTLSESERREVLQIDGALSRMGRGQLRSLRRLWAGDSHGAPPGLALHRAL
jgi:RNA polymerase-binding transcription factor DksA